VCCLLAPRHGPLPPFLIVFLTPPLTV
jgi:hypothetical protein